MAFQTRLKCHHYYKKKKKTKTQMSEAENKRKAYIEHNRKYRRQKTEFGRKDAICEHCNYNHKKNVIARHRQTRKHRFNELEHRLRNEFTFIDEGFFFVLFYRSNFFRSLNHVII